MVAGRSRSGVGLSTSLWGLQVSSSNVVQKGVPLLGYAHQASANSRLLLEGVYRTVGGYLAFGTAGSPLPEPIDRDTGQAPKHRVRQRDRVHLQGDVLLEPGAAGSTGLLPARQADPKRIRGASTASSGTPV